MHLLIMASCFAAALATAVRAEEIALTAEAKIVLATPEAATEILRQSDAFTQIMSALDRQLRMRTDAKVSESDFLKFASEQTLHWTAAETDRLRETIESCRQRLAGWDLPLPDSIPLIKTNGKEEGGAAYTRGDAIILPETMVGRGGPNLEALLMHELFHVISRRDPALRRKLYAIVGFTPCGKGELPRELEQRRITNPDAPIFDYAVSLEIEGRTAEYLPLIRSRSTDPTGGLKIGDLEFLLLEIRGDGDRWQPALKGDKPNLLPIKNAAYQARIGRNTGYIIHAEEVLADNFSLLMRRQSDVPSPEILQELAAALKQQSAQPGEQAEANEE